jgi:glucose/arabinose dehydrogenase
VNPQTGQQTVLRIVSDCYDIGESGLLGMALYPNFVDTPWVYYVYTYQQGSQIRERLVRSTYNAQTQSLGNDTTLLNDIPGNSTHNGSRLLFLPDRTFLMTTGDAQNLQAPLNPANLAGKVLRMLPNGGIPANNPTPGSRVYTLGHRNAQGILLHPNGRIYSSEHGPNADDEINEIIAGRNYGWPTVSGLCDNANEIAYCNANDVKVPMRVWTPTIAPAGMIWYDHPRLPVFRKRIILTTLKNTRLYVMELDSAGNQIISEQQYLNNVYGRLRDIVADPEGNIYLATNGVNWTNDQPFTHRIVKLSAAWSNTSLATVSIENGAQVYPMPLLETSRLQVKPEWVGKRVLITDVQGRTLHSFTAREEISLLDAAAWPQGLLFLQIEGVSGALKLMR